MHLGLALGLGKAQIALSRFGQRQIHRGDAFHPIPLSRRLIASECLIGKFHARLLHFAIRQ